MGCIHVLLRLEHGVPPCAVFVRAGAYAQCLQAQGKLNLVLLLVTSFSANCLVVTATVLAMRLGWAALLQHSGAWPD